MYGGQPQTIKVVLLGEGRVGKTSLAQRYVRSSFNEGQAATVQAAFFTKAVRVQGQEIEVALWDTAGQEKFHSLGPIYYRDAHAALLVFDITDTDSFKRVKRWVDELHAMAGERCQLVIAANKQDLQHRSVSEEEAQEFAASQGAAYFQTSAKTGLGLEELFTALLSSVLDSLKDQRLHAAQGMQTTGRRHGGLVVASQDSISERKSSTCC
ncbi:hypothetical protein WJX74_004647 [Apatococcus lobatus]|uniref:Ras-related protein Rab-21 n=1 Tax=Apatococcus lobatus TaxID=904363 RepID=A0AAW1QC53_9CHLO